MKRLSSDPDYRLLFSRESDPSINLAMEETLFQTRPAGSSIVVIYRNNPSVICGRFQNPWLETDLDWLLGQGISVYRRSSGGGTVWHDEGNWNFSFMCDREQFNHNQNLTLLAGWLQQAHFPVQINARGDLLLEDKKISGNALIKKGHGVLHHCSLLVDADLGYLRRALRKPALGSWGASSRAVASVPSSVTRLVDSGTSWKSAALFLFLQELAAKHFRTSFSEIDSLGFDQSATTIFQNHKIRLQSWDWNFGQTPDFKIENPSIKSLAGDGVLGLSIHQGHFETGQLADALQCSYQKFAGFAELDARLVRMGIVGFNE